MKHGLRFTLVAISALLLALSASNSKLTERQRALQALNRLSFGARPGDVDRVLKTGVDNWIAQQLHPENIPDRAVEARLQQFPTLTLSDAQLMQQYYRPIVEARRDIKKAVNNPADLDPKERQEVMMLRKNAQQVTNDLVSQRIIRASESERQLNEVMVDFWFNHFNVFAGKGVDRFMLTSYERDVIRPHMWGRFEDLLMATAKSPAMLFYLDNARSVADPEHRPAMPPRVAARMAANPKQQQNRGGLNENYAREIMELHTLGVDGGYTQNDVTELARVLTGWTIAPPQQGGGFVFRPMLHDIGPKTVLGIRFPAGGGIEEGEKMIHILAHHPATAHHIAYQLAQRLVADDPPKALVDRVAKRFLDTDGDLRETVKAVIDSPEFWDPKYYRAKVKSPFEYTISAVRAIDGQITDATPIARELQKDGEPLYGAQPPTGYSDRADAWVNTGALLNRLNFALALAANKMPGVRSDVVALIPAEAAADPQKSVDALAKALTGGELTDATRKTIEARVVERKAPTTDPWDNTQLPTIAGLILGSPEFQKQ
ncbi:MAG TPA: DUF1800 domain-containing protein [Thermoanaerobaculia bacterium]